MTVNYKTYDLIKTKFFRKHKHDFKIETSQMDSYGRYHKEYIFKDGAIWYESYSRVEEVVETTTRIHEVEVKLENTVEFFRTEFWSTDDAESGYYYELF